MLHMIISNILYAILISVHEAAAYLNVIVVVITKNYDTGIRS